MSAAQKDEVSKDFVAVGVKEDSPQLLKNVLD